MSGASAYGGAYQACRAYNDFDHSPRLLYFEITQACDLAYDPSVARPQPRRHPGELDAPDVHLLIDQLLEFPKPPMLVLMGGDPLKRPDLFELVEYASNAGLEVTVAAAATPLVTRDAIRRLRDAGLSRLAVRLDGADAALHDGWGRNAGSFRRTLDILEAARSLDLPTQVDTLIRIGNHEQVGAMADLVARAGIIMWSVSFLVPVDRASGNHCLSADQSEKVFAELWRQTQRQVYLIRTTEAPQYRRYAIQHQLPRARGARRVNVPPTAWVPTGLNDGKGIMFVGHTGLIHPSGMMPIFCGIFPVDHLVRVYQRSPIFRGLRDSNLLQGKCSRCEFRCICGGSRARAYAFTGNPYAQEPFCNYIPQGIGASAN